MLIYTLPCVKYIASKQLQYRQLMFCSGQRGRMGNWGGNSQRGSIRGRGIPAKQTGGFLLKVGRRSDITSEWGGWGEGEESWSDTESKHVWRMGDTWALQDQT